MFDAYTVKKVVPRLLIAAILIQLSWPIFTYMIYAVGQIAWGVEGLLYAPFGGAENLTLAKIFARAELTTAGATLVFGGAAISIAAMTLGGAALAGISIFLGLLIAFFVLAARQVLIVILLVTAPLALVAWILPNTEKVWKIWWESFSKILLMYPLILLLIAGGRITAHIVSGTRGIDTGNGSFKTALIIIAFIGPYFLIPATFKVAGSAFANITGIMNDRSRGVFDRLRKGRQERSKRIWGDRWQRADESRYFDPNSRLGKALNSPISAARNPWGYAQIKAGTKTGKRIMSQIDQSKADSTMKLAQKLQGSGMNDRALAALTYWDGTQNGMQGLIRQLEENPRDANDTLAADQLRSNEGMLYGLHKDEELGRGDYVAAAGLAKASLGFTSKEEIAQETARVAERTGSTGVANWFKTQSELAGGKAGALTKPGYSVLPDGSGGFKAGNYDDYDDPAYSQISKIGVADIGASKGLLGKQYRDFNTGEIVKTGDDNSVGGAMVKMLTRDPNSLVRKQGESNEDFQERQQKVVDEKAALLSTLSTAFNSYNNAAVRKDISTIFDRAGITPPTVRGFDPNEGANLPAGGENPLGPQGDE